MNQCGCLCQKSKRTITTHHCNHTQAPCGDTNLTMGMLLCRSTSRLSSGQRVALNDVEEAHMEDREGRPYWVFEHLSQVCSTALG